MIRELLGKKSKIQGAKNKWTLATVPGVVAAGHYTGEPFDGADTVPYNGVADALDFWLDNYSGYDLTIFDGDRFSFKNAVKFFQDRVPEHTLVCVRFDGPADERRAGRNAATGKAQNATWLKGRKTKAWNFFCDFPGEKYDLLNVGNPAAVAKLLLETLK